MSTHKQKVRDWAKVAVGLVLADAITGIWLVSSNILPIKLLGVTWDSSLVYLGITFDILLLLILIHYAWHPAVMEPTVSRRGLFILIGILTGVVGLAHLYRVATGLDFQVGSIIIPMWLSWIGAFVTLYISYASFHFIKK